MLLVENNPMQKQRIIAYLRARKTQGAKFYVRKKGLGETALKAINFDLTDIGDYMERIVGYHQRISAWGEKARELDFHARKFLVH